MIDFSQVTNVTVGGQEVVKIEKGSDVLWQKVAPGPAGDFINFTGWTPEGTITADNEAIYTGTGLNISQSDNGATYDLYIRLTKTAEFTSRNLRFTDNQFYFNYKDADNNDQINANIDTADIEGGSEVHKEGQWASVYDACTIVKAGFMNDYVEDQDSNSISVGAKEYEISADGNYITLKYFEWDSDNSQWLNKLFELKVKMGVKYINE